MLPPHNPEIQSFVFTTLEAYGPKSDSQLRARKFGVKEWLAAEVASLGISLLIVPVILALGLAIRLMFSHIGAIAWLITTIVFFMFFFSFVHSRILFKSQDLVDIYRRRRFEQLFCLYAGLGFIAGMGIAFAISEKPGVLLPRDYDFYRTVILFICGMAFAGPIFSLLHVLIFDSKDRHSIEMWIQEWKNSIA